MGVWGKGMAFESPALRRNSWNCLIHGYLKGWGFLDKLKGCQATTSSPASCSGPATACTAIVRDGDPMVGGVHFKKAPA